MKDIERYLTREHFDKVHKRRDTPRRKHHTSADLCKKFNKDGRVEYVSTSKRSSRT